MIWRRVLAVVLWLAYCVLGGIGGVMVWHAGLALYALYLLFLWCISGAVWSVLAETLWNKEDV